MIDHKVLSVLYSRLEAKQKELTQLLEKAETETSHRRMGGFYETDSEFAACYVQSDIVKLERAIEYHIGTKQPYGWKWVYKDFDEVDIAFDTDVPPEKHPEYLSRVNKAINDKEKEDFLLLFTRVNYNKDTRITDLFQYTYFFEVKNLIPDSSKLLKAIKSDSTRPAIRVKLKHRGGK